ncbi:uncharacterized protein [Mytilus edulis]|uniref:uncharacterized protein n=1 Tax=Mytilus edulis TaxID=6550 RepID=UPI0039EDEDF9
MDIFILLTVLQMVSLNEAYNFTCPSQAHWNIWAKSTCKPPRNYTCLFDVTLRVNVYKERCRTPRILAPGYKYVFQPYLNRATCSVTRYQPFIFDTIGNSDCAYQKSLCNSLGQETYKIGNTTVDIKCICNTDRGYTFVINSNDQCYCDPSTEDCSCYLGINPYNTTVALKDINCYDDLKMTKSSFLGDRYNISRKIKIVELNNYKYNINNVPTTEYRIEAAKWVMILSFAYCAVWIIVMRIIRRWIRIRIIPRNFDIVESTDCSITIAWFIDVLDKCISYELYRRHIATDDVTLRKFSSEDVLEGGKGRRMYKLQNMLPETYYEFKLRSVYNDVKSHYSESITRQTLKLVLPEAINQLSEEDKIRFNKVMQSSQTENRYFVRIMIVGKESVGKTCLLRRLLKEPISDVTSTDGVDIVVRRCKINIEDGTWKIGEVTEDDKVNRIKRAISPNESDKSTTGNYREMNLPKLRNMQMQDRSAKDDTSEIGNNVPLIEPKHDVSDEKITTADMHGCPAKEGIITRDNEFTKENLDENIDNNESVSLVMPEDLVSHVFTNSVLNTQSIHTALCELWDFAGQKEFYATHQAFLTCNAVYLVVADMNEDISKQGISQYFADFQDVGEYVDFWFESIHCHRTVDDPESEHFDPPIILVFTGKDKFDEEYIPKRIEKLDKQLDKVLGDQSRHHHLRDKFYLSNTEDPDDAFERLRTAIFDTARIMDNWGQALPMKWILLEHLIEINKAQGTNFINFTDMINMAKHPDINILSEDELLVFLRFQHNVGNMIFFENIRDLIILKPQWLADAFRCLVSDRIEAKFHHLSDYKLLKDQGKISKSLITKLFKSKKASQFLGQQGNLHQIMEKLDIIVKIDTNYYIMPSKMPASTFEDVCKHVGIRNTDCKRTSWLCLKFDFLPPSFFNHLSAWFIRNYKPSKLDSESGSFALYRGICMFDMDSSGCVKILVTMSTDTIALQVVSFSKQREVGNKCSDIYQNVKDVVEKIRKSYKVKISFKLHFKCSDGDYYKDTFVYETLTSEQEFYCPQHKTSHQSEMIYSPWITKEIEKIPDDIEKKGTLQDDLNPKNEPNKDEAFAQDQTPIKTNLPVSVNLRKQLNIRTPLSQVLIVSCIKIGNTLVFSNRRNKSLTICNAHVTEIHDLPLSYKPHYITVVDSNTVAVSCTYDRTILIINISTRSVTSEINTSGGCYGISYNDNNLYVVIDMSIMHEMDMTGTVIRTITLPSNDINDITVDRDRLVCIDKKTIHCCSLDGELLWKFENDKFQDLRSVTTDYEGNVYVINFSNYTVVVVSDDGKHFRELVTESDGLECPVGIYFDKKESVLLVSLLQFLLVGVTEVFDLIKLTKKAGFFDFGTYSKHCGLLQFLLVGVTEVFDLIKLTKKAGFFDFGTYSKHCAHCSEGTKMPRRGRKKSDLSKKKEQRDRMRERRIKQANNKNLISVDNQSATSLNCPTNQSVNSLNCPTNNDQSINSLNCPMQLEQSVNSINCPILLDQSVTSINCPILLDQSVTSINCPILLDQSVNSINCPIQLDQSINSINCPKPLDQSVNSINCPIQQDQSVNSINCPIQLDQSVNSINCPILLDQSVNSINCPIKQDESINSINCLMKQDQSVNSINCPIKLDQSVNSINCPIKQDQSFNSLNCPTNNDQSINSLNCPTNNDQSVDSLNCPYNNESINSTETIVSKESTKLNLSIKSESQQSVKSESQQSVKSELKQSIKSIQLNKSM